MQQASKRIDQKFNTISKIQLNFRQKKLDYAAFLSGNRLDLPPISSVTVNFPSARQERVEVKNSRKRKHIIELDKLLESNSGRVSNDELNRIIFASPLKNRMTFQRTFFRSSIYYTIEGKKNRSSLHPKELKTDETARDSALLLTPIKTKQQNQKSQSLGLSAAIEANIQSHLKQAKFSNMFDSNPQTILENRKRERIWRGKNVGKLGHESLHLSGQRYSPWRNDELEQQLLMGKKQKQQKNEGHFQMFVSGLPYTCTEETLSQFLAADSVSQIKLPKFQDSGRCLGYAHVVFTDELQYKKTLERSGESMNNRYLEMKPAKGSKSQVIKKVSIPVGCKRLFVKNLPYTIEEEEIRSQFSSCGIITDIRMVRNWANKNFKGFAYIDYRDIGSVKKAIDKYHGKAFKGRSLVLDAVTSEQKKGFHRHDPNYNPSEQAEI